MNKLRSVKLRGALALIVAAGLLPVMGYAQPNAPLDADDETVQLERFEVTGSHISGIDVAGLNPVASIPRDTLDLGGYTTVGDALRSLSFISGSSIIPSGSGNSFTPGASSVNLRGLGVNNVLVLLNGRRSAPLATPGYNGLQTMFDLNSIPAAAIESIEVLKDGASAIYGSDAVSGVINVIMRKNYQGLNTTIGFGNTLNTDSLEKTASLVMGVTSGKLSLTTAVDWTERNGTQEADYYFSRNADLTSRGGPDLRSYAGYPGMAYVPSLDDYYTVTAPTANPTINDFVLADVSHGSYNFQEAAGQIPESRQFGFYTRGQFDFSDTLYGFTEITFRRSESVINAAPTPVFSYTENGSGPNTGTLNIPAHNPNNPFGEDLEDEWYARLVNAGPRVNDVSSDTPRIVVGIGGEIASEWKWEAATLYSKNETQNLNGGAVFDNLYQDALNGIEIGGDVLYANPFGPEDPRVTAYYTGMDPNSSTFELRSFDISANGPLFQLPAGDLSVAVGGEWREEEMSNVRSINNATGNIVGGAEGTSTRGDRTVKAAYLEVHVPIISDMQLQVAGRFEEYSDFGSTTKPKVAWSYRPTEWLLLRSSFGQSFHAPDLAYLYTSQVTTFSSSPLKDPKRPNDAPRQIETKGGGNPDLQPEETDSVYVGFQLNPTGALKGFEIAVDWLQFKQTNLIAQLGEDYILEHEDELPGSVVRNPPGAGENFGVINYINDVYRNIDSQTYRGIDIELRYRLNTSSLGRFTFSAGGTYLQKLRYNDEDFEGTYNYPFWRGTFITTWEKGDWSASIIADYISEFENYSEVGTMGSQFQVHPQVSYRGFRDIKLTVGARNVFNQDPPFDEHSSTGYNQDISIPEKAFVYFRASKDF
jgi:Outer membrane receptor for ferrienterochelin and colicins